MAENKNIPYTVYVRGCVYVRIYFVFVIKITVQDITIHVGDRTLSVM